MIIPPKCVVSKAVETIKKNTSRSLIGKFAFLKKYIGTEKAYGEKAFCVYGRDKRRNNPKIRKITRKGRERTSKA